MTTPTIQALILAGGQGSRLWPLSRAQSPKQFLALDGADSMLDATAKRLQPFIAPEAITVISSESTARGHGYAALQQFATILEPVARNTAPAIAVAALKFALQGEDPVLVVLPSDHVITDVPAFHVCLKSAVDAANTGKLVTFGVTPTRPDTGFGYIKTAAENVETVRRVLQFKEKPDLATAEQFLRDGGYFWNSGMFVWKASAILKAVAQTLPAMQMVLDKISADVTTGMTFNTALKANFGASPSISIDHGVLEKTTNLFLIPADIGWSDAGTWDAVYEITQKDEHGNASRGNAITIDCKNILVRSEKRFIAVVGLEDVTVIETADAVLVTKHGHSQKVSQVVKTLAERGSTEHHEHLTVNRPWGSYTVLEEAPGFKLKRIEVAPNGRLSLQSHKHRSEHWVVVRGKALVTRGPSSTVLSENESTFIPAGVKHRLENIGDEPLQIIEVQVGSYVGEDDIERFDDQYGRIIEK